MSKTPRPHRPCPPRAPLISHILEALESRVMMSVAFHMPPPLNLNPPSTPVIIRGRFAPPAAVYPTLDGSGNNREHEDWGAAGAALLRLVDAAYSDGIASPAGEDRASPREISNAVVAQSESITNDRGLSNLLWLWGQFIDHDMDLTIAANPAEPFNISVPSGDPHFDPAGTGTVEIPFSRSSHDPDTGLDINAPRDQINQISSFIDGSMIYGTDDARAAALRSFIGGRMNTSEGDLLPFNVQGLANAGGPGAGLFLAGDLRANENVALTAMHTIWVREHNRIADRISADKTSLSDEEIYRRARAMVIAEIQAITFNEFLPALLGKHAIEPYQGYNADVNPTIANLFSTAAYRFGHSLLPSELPRLDSDGQTLEAGNLALRDAFFNPGALTDHGVDSILRGLAAGLAQELDPHIVDDVRNFLFGPPGSGGFDLASLNIQRGRDHGLPSYNQTRAALGLQPASSFADITSDTQRQAQLQSVYADVEAVDVWIGALAEDHVPGASVGEVIRTILVDQFSRVRDGDGFWYQNIYHGATLRQIESTTLSDVIERNSGITGLQANVFLVPGTSAEPTPPPPPNHPPHLNPPPRNLGHLLANADRDATRQRAEGDQQRLPPPPPPPAASLTDRPTKPESRFLPRDYNLRIVNLDDQVRPR